jgi:fatty-acyl-CoA synthase
MRFAIARLGAVLVPVNFMLNAREIAFILQNSGARCLVVGPGLLEVGRAALIECPKVTLVVGVPEEGTEAPSAVDIGFDDLISGTKEGALPPCDARDVAQIVYTSGTESSPKGVVLTHEAIMWQYVSCIVDGEMRADDVVLHALPLYHCAQLDVFLGPSVYLGATNVITGQPTPGVLLPMFAQHGITSFFAPPSVWIALLRSQLFDTTYFSAFRKGYYGASIMPVAVLHELQRRLPKVRLWNFYGQTEIAPLATVLKPEDQLRKAGSAGKPVLNVETRLVDHRMHDVAVGQIGEIVHRSPHLMKGYYNDPEKTAAAFDGGWFHSGDLAVIDAEGFITVVDRKKDMIKSAGENVSSREVEETIYGLPAVAEVAVVGVQDPLWIEAVTAVVVLRENEQLDDATLIAHCKTHLAHFKVPKRVLFVPSLPKNPSGKVLKRELRQQFDGR